MTRRLMAAALLVCACASTVWGAKFTLTQDEEGVSVCCDGQLFTRYILKSGAKPVLWPLVGPTGQEMTRGYPLREARGAEKQDHVHQRSCWFTHGKVNDISFWDEADGHGTIEHLEYLTLTEGDKAVIRTRNAWKAPNGDVLCEDLRTMTFGADSSTRWIDFSFTVKAVQPQVVFGDTKEGSFGVRVASSLPVDEKAGGKIVNSDGLTDEQAWGKRAAWVDYYGPVNGHVVGIAILNHPQSLRYPTYWHVRTYGLFAANPFGVHDFGGQSGADGALTLKAGESFSLFYRVILHAGDEKTGQIREAFERYQHEPVAP
jgi:hypothetical protein